MSRSSLTEETPATPGWVDARIRAIFAPFGATAETTRDAYADCLASVGGAADVNLAHDRCRTAAVRALADIAEDPNALDRDLQALEAEISSST